MHRKAHERPRLFVHTTTAPATTPSTSAGPRAYRREAAATYPAAASAADHSTPAAALAGARRR